MFYLNVLLGVLNHCATDRAIQVHNISGTICIINIIPEQFTMKAHPALFEGEGEGEGGEGQK